MNWNEKVNARGWKLPLIGKSLFQIGKELRPKVDRFIMRRSLVPDSPIMDKSYFPWIAELEKHWQDIRNEALNISANEIPSLSDISFDHGRIAADKKWKSFFLKGYGYDMGNNCDRAPLTTSLIEKVPGLVTASYSVMAAGGHIPRHWGMTKGMLTLHLPLKVPREWEKCRMHVEGPREIHVIQWRDGESVLFDDMYNHEVWNETNDDRYVLLIQIRRPCRGIATCLQSLFLFGVRHSRFVQDIRRNIEATAETASPSQSNRR